MKYFTKIVIIVVCTAVVAGLWFVGSPAKVRQKRFDDVRLSNLQMIQSEIINYWQQKAKLPVVLGDLNNSTGGFSLPKDPQSGIEYKYSVKNAESFILCANFLLSSDEGEKIGGTNMGGYSYAYPANFGMENWSHGAGEVCFDRTIDKELYKPLKTF